MTKIIAVLILQADPKAVLKDGKLVYELDLRAKGQRKGLTGEVPERTTHVMSPYLKKGATLYIEGKIGPTGNRVAVEQVLVLRKVKP